MFLRKSQSLLLASIFCAFLWVGLAPSAVALTEPGRGNANINATRNNNTNSGEDFNPKTGLDAFEKEANKITEQARLGNELAQLPGPQINFKDLMRLVITWSASLAASVAIFLLVFRSFAAISGTEESHNQLKSGLIKIMVGLGLIFFSYQLVSLLMSIIWAGS